MDTRDRPTDLLGIAADAGLIVGHAAALAITAFAIADSWGGGYWVFGCAAGLVMGALALMRRRHPGWAAGVGLAVAAVAIVVAQVAHLPAEPGPAAAVGLYVLIGSAIRALPIRWAATIATAGLALVVGAGLTAPASPSGVPAVLTFNGAGWLAALATGLGLRLLDTRRRTVAEQVRRAERLDLARELHDIVAHHITGVVLHAQAAQVVRRKYPEELDDSLAGIETAGSEALAAMRRVVDLLRDTDDAAPATPGPEQLSALVERFTSHGRTVHLRLPDDEPEWPPEVTSTVYRVVQESLTNIAKHAPHAHSVTVRVTHDHINGNDITQEQPTITVEITDDAPPHPPRYPHRSGYGLVGMRERVEALDGTLRAGPCSSTGWSVRAVLPLPARELR
ncbi:signal transduction histidine kinase [Saccharothrix tamanrassetensis]|uniref:histidine kinase n=1 Tax=Saccharothrix tamanrassetensis TaxID=1051531 RepID=A0A841CAU8_9PSEU|nr:histidine kinase [Saccharothrix tamanrassetensis]MBB5954331.1 signal transduction histidine kinase [Saccharothrix tamanrassetensis]